MKTHRLARVAEAIREVASATILYELHDPRVKFVTVTRAEVSGDLQHAKVYVSIMGTDKEQQLTLRGLKHAAGYVQSKLAKRLQTRFTPVLQFVLDQGVKHSIEMTRLINEALAQPGERDQSVPLTESEPGGRDTLVPHAPAAGADDAPQQAGSADGTVEEGTTDS
jgi:ribosome-binding factor A